MTSRIIQKLKQDLIHDQVPEIQLNSCSGQETGSSYTNLDQRSRENGLVFIQKRLGCNSQSKEPRGLKSARG